MKIDRRKSYYILLDTETCNTRMVDGKLDMSDVLVYDICWAVVDKKGNIYKTGAYLVDEIFNEEQELMATADTLEELFEKFKNLCNTRHEDEEYNLVFDDETLDELVVAFRQKDKVRINNPIAVVKPGKAPYKMVLVKGKRKKVVLPPRFDLFDFAVIQKIF